jgi:WD40 repeat protein
MDLVSTLEGHEDRVWCVSWSPASNLNDQLLATSSSDKKIKIWGIDSATQNWTCLCTMDEGHTKTIRHLAWSP